MRSCFSLKKSALSQLFKYSAACVRTPPPPRRHGPWPFRASDCLRSCPRSKSDPNLKIAVHASPISLADHDRRSTSKDTRFYACRNDTKKILLDHCTQEIFCAIMLCAKIGWERSLHGYAARNALCADDFARMWREFHHPWCNYQSSRKSL